MKHFHLSLVLLIILFHNKSISCELTKRIEDESLGSQTASSSITTTTTDSTNINFRILISDDEVSEYLKNFNPTADVYLGYRRLNEEDTLITLYNKFINIHFEQLDKDQYKAFVAQNHLFDTKAPLERKIFNLMLWARLAGCPLLGVNECHPFFHSSLHIYEPSKAKEMVERVEEKTRQKFKDIPEDMRGSLIESYPYAEYSTKVGVKVLTDEATFFSRAITADLRNEAIIYQYLNGQSTNVDKDRYNRERDTHFERHQPPKISYEFLQAYIIPLTQIPYLDNVLEALQRLPKSVINLMRGKAIYLSKASGPSVTISSCSHNAPITSYLGFIPGVFVEHSLVKKEPKISTLTKNNITFENIIHEVGHLIDHMVLRSFYAPLNGSDPTIPFFYQYEDFLKLSSNNLRKALFKGNPLRLQQSNDQFPGVKGFMTHYSEKDADEDFAEHFKFYILDKYDEENPAPLTPATKKERKHKLKKVNETMTKLLFKARSQTEQDVLLHKWNFMQYLVNKAKTDYKK